MDKIEFVTIRRIFDKTQKEMAQLLGVSLRSIQSFEQGWRNISDNIERQALYLLALKNKDMNLLRPCWEIEECPDKKRVDCPAWEFNNGKLCWFINGTICQGEPHKDWTEKMDYCRKCRVFMQIMELVETKAVKKE